MTYAARTVEVVRHAERYFANSVLPDDLQHMEAFLRRIGNLLERQERDIRKLKHLIRQQITRETLTIVADNFKRDGVDIPVVVPPMIWTNPL